MAAALPRRLTRDEARRIAVRAQMLESDRPGYLLGVVDRLTFLQLDPTAAIAPSADLVAWSRLGSVFRPDNLRHAVEVERVLFEHHAQPVEVEPVLALLRPMADLGLYLAEMEALRSRAGRRLEWLLVNDRFRRDVLELLGTSGPLQSRDIPDTSAVPWQSTGWTNDRNVTRMLEILAARGEVAVSARRGRVRLWDLAERVYPAVETVPIDEARRVRAARLLRALGVARPRYVGDAGVAAEVEGTEGEWRVDPDATADGFVGRTALLSPFDRLVHDRVRAVDLFDFEYVLEVYKPKDQRRWGYFSLPVLHHDRMVGKLDATADRKASLLEVHAVHEDIPFTEPIRAAVTGEIVALAQWLGLDEVRLP